MDYTMNNQSLDDLIKRDKKLGRPIHKGGAKQQAGKPKPGKRPNKIQQQRAQVQQAKSKQGGGGGQAKQQQSQKQPQKLGSRKGGIAKRPAQPQAQRTLKSNQGTPKGRSTSNQARPSAGQGNPRQQVAAQRRQKLLNLKLQKKGIKSQAQNGVRVKKAQPAVTKPQQQAPIVPQGTLAQRKIKVRNIDASTVSVAELQRLFSSSGPIISAGFDKNMHGMYLGSATIIYAKSAAAAAAIKEYNGAQVDERCIKVEYALPQEAPQRTTPVSQKRPSTSGASSARQAPSKQPLKIKRAGNAIQKKDSGSAKAKPGSRGGKSLGAKTLRLNPEKGGGGSQQQKGRRVGGGKRVPGRGALKRGGAIRGGGSARSNNSNSRK